MWSGRRNGPVFVTTKIAKTLDECHEMLGDLYEVGVLMYFFRLSDAAILKIITHEAKGVLAVKQLRKKNFPLSILKDRKLSTIAVFAIFLAILYTAGIITGPDLILWLKIIFGG
jgi:hypothetical protein